MHCICKKGECVRFIDNFERKRLYNASKQICFNPLQGDQPLSEGFPVRFHGEADPGLRGCPEHESDKQTDNLPGHTGHEGR